MQIVFYIYKKRKNTFMLILFLFYLVGNNLQRNYPYFMMFISTSTALCLYVFVFSWINLLRRGGSLGTAISHDIPSIMLIVYCFISIWFVGGLTVFHFYLICTNQVYILYLILSFIATF